MAVAEPQVSAGVVGRSGDAVTTLEGTFYVLDIAASVEGSGDRIRRWTAPGMTEGGPAGSDAGEPEAGAAGSNAAA